MYGTVARMRVKPGQAQALMALAQKQNQEVEESIKGYGGEFVYRLDKNPNEYILVVVFKDKQSYQANANDPEQDKRYREIRALLEADPEWNDGEIVYHVGTLAISE